VLVLLSIIKKAKSIFLWGIFSTVSLPFYVSAENNELVVRYNQFTLFANDSAQQYFSSLLKLALDETSHDFGPYLLSPVDIDMVQQRTISMLQANKVIDVLWTVTSNEREQTMQAVYIPLLKGLMGTRIFLIRKKEQYRFNNIKTMEDLYLLTAGQGDNWPDTQIIKENKLPVQTAKAELLYYMLAKKRFDYFPRAATEIQKEASQYPEFVIENNLMLNYLSPIYFFVNKDNPQLAVRIETGLLRAIENGRFDKLFRKANNIEHLSTQLNLTKRRVFKLENSIVSNKTKAIQHEAKFWLFQ
jgi:hypothetical protein